MRLKKKASCDDGPNKILIIRTLIKFMQLNVFYSMCKTYYLHHEQQTCSMKSKLYEIIIIIICTQKETSVQVTKNARFYFF